MLITIFSDAIFACLFYHFRFDYFLHFRCRLSFRFTPFISSFHFSFSFSHISLSFYRCWYADYFSLLRFLICFFFFRWWCHLLLRYAILCRYYFFIIDYRCCWFHDARMIFFHSRYFSFDYAFFISLIFHISDITISPLSSFSLFSFLSLIIIFFHDFAYYDYLILFDAYFYAIIDYFSCRWFRCLAYLRLFSFSLFRFYFVDADDFHDIFDYFSLILFRLFDYSMPPFFSLMLIIFFFFRFLISRCLFIFDIIHISIWFDFRHFLHLFFAYCHFLHDFIFPYFMPLFSDAISTFISFFLIISYFSFDFSPCSLYFDIIVAFDALIDLSMMQRVLRKMPSSGAIKSAQEVRAAQVKRGMMRVIYYFRRCVWCLIDADAISILLCFDAIICLMSADARCRFTMPDARRWCRCRAMMMFSCDAARYAMIDAARVARLSCAVADVYLRCHYFHWCRFSMSIADATRDIFCWRFSAF